MKIKALGMLPPITRQKVMIEFTERFWKDHTHKANTAKLQARQNPIRLQSDSTHARKLRTS